MRMRDVKAMSHNAIFLATCNAFLLLRDVKLGNTHLHSILLTCSSHIKHSSLVKMSQVKLQVARKIASCDSALRKASTLANIAPIETAQV